MMNKSKKSTEELVDEMSLESILHAIAQAEEVLNKFNGRLALLKILARHVGKLHALIVRYAMTLLKLLHRVGLLLTEGVEGRDAEACAAFMLALGALEIQTRLLDEAINATFVEVVGQVYKYDHIDSAEELVDALENSEEVVAAFLEAVIHLTAASASTLQSLALISVNLNAMLQRVYERNTLAAVAECVAELNAAVMAREESEMDELVAECVADVVAEEELDTLVAEVVAEQEAVEINELAERAAAVDARFDAVAKGSEDVAAEAKEMQDNVSDLKKASMDLRSRAGNVARHGLFSENSNNSARKQHGGVSVSNTEMAEFYQRIRSI
jgi:hypothetical protein